MAGPPELPVRGPSARIMLVRHGQTDDNVEPIRAQGFSDTPLNETGRRQAREAAERLAAGPPVGSLWASDLSRAVDTATTIGRALALEPILDRRLREGDRGRWEGRLFVDIERDEPELYAAWRRAGPEFRFPGGESLGELQARVAAAVGEIEGRGPLPALVVCHGGPIQAMLCLKDRRGLHAFHDFRVPNLAMVAL